MFLSIQEHRGFLPKVHPNVLEYSRTQRVFTEGSPECSPNINYFINNKIIQITKKYDKYNNAYWYKYYF
jgi:hypothetical protein